MWYNCKTLTVGCPKWVCRPLWKNLHCPLLFDTPKYAWSLCYSKTKSIKKICKKNSTRPGHTHAILCALTHSHPHIYIYIYANTLWLNKEKVDKFEEKKNNNCHFGRIVLTEKKLPLWQNSTYWKKLPLWQNSTYWKKLPLWQNSTYWKKLPLWQNSTYSSYCKMALPLWQNSTHCKAALPLWQNGTHCKTALPLWQNSTYLTWWTLCCHSHHSINIHQDTVLKLKLLSLGWNTG